MKNNSFARSARAFFIFDISQTFSFFLQREPVLQKCGRRYHIMTNVQSTSFPGSLFSASLSRWNKDPGCGWSRDHLAIENRRVGGCSSTFGREDDKIPHPSCRFFYHPDSGWSPDQPQSGSLFQRLRDAEKRDPGNEVDVQFCLLICEALVPI